MARMTEEAYNTIQPLQRLCPNKKDKPNNSNTAHYNFLFSHIHYK
jgi:hypothetical protein